MATVYLETSLSSFIICEYFLIAMIFTYHGRKHIQQKVKVDITCVLYFLLVLVILATRILIITGFFEDWGLKFKALMITSGYTACFIFYTMVFYHWFKIYIHNLFHISYECKERAIRNIGRALSVVDCLVIVSHIFIVLVIYIHLVSLSSSPGVICIIYHLTLASFIFIILIPMGIVLLRQIKYYATQKPWVLIICVYITIIGFTLGIVCILMALLIDFKENTTLR